MRQDEVWDQFHQIYFVFEISNINKPNVRCRNLRQNKSYNFLMALKQSSFLKLATPRENATNFNGPAHETFYSYHILRVKGNDSSI